MAARPRKYQDLVENLYKYKDKRDGKIYYRYKHPENGKFIGFGTDKKEALAAARIANETFAKRRLDQLQFIKAQEADNVRITGISAKQWAKLYLKRQAERVERKEIKPSTLENKERIAKAFAQRFGTKGIKEIEVKDIVAALEEYRARGVLNEANNVRSEWIDMFKDAQRAGEVSSGFNPVEVTKSFKVEVVRNRISIEAMDMMMQSEKYLSLHNTQMLFKLAITTGLRNGDLSRLQFSHVYDGHLHVSLGKSGGKTKLAFPLNLTNPYLGESLEDIIGQCRQSGILSPYLLHLRRGKMKGKKCSEDSLRRSVFAVKKSCPDLKDKKLPLHEFRSFAARTYKAAGYNTKDLLGHKSQAMTDHYTDEREAAYLYITTPEAV